MLFLPPSIELFRLDYTTDAFNRFHPALGEVDKTQLGHIYIGWFHWSSPRLILSLHGKGERKEITSAFFVPKHIHKGWAAIFQSRPLCVQSSCDDDALVCFSARLTWFFTWNEFSVHFVVQYRSMVRRDIWRLTYMRKRLLRILIRFNLYTYETCRFRAAGKEKWSIAIFSSRPHKSDSDHGLRARSWLRSGASLPTINFKRGNYLGKSVPFSSISKIDSQTIFY